MRLAMFSKMNIDSNVLFRRAIAVILTSLMVFSVGCGEEEKKKGMISLPSTEEPEPIILDFKVQTTLPFYVPHSVHRSSDGDNWSTPCRIPTTSALGTSINCLLEINELDLWFQSFDFKVEVPPNMCEYVVAEGFWFFQYEPGIIPSNSTVTITFEDDEEPVVAFDPPTTDITVTFDAEGDPQVNCRFDYSNSGGPNCCSGKTVVTEITITTPEGGCDPEETRLATPIDWGGKIGNCAAGPGAHADNIFGRSKDQNIPISQIFDTKRGRTLSMTIASSASGADSGLPFFTNRYSANWLKNRAADGLPAPMSMTFGGVTLGEPDYYWSCVDGAFEEKARISLQIREWNTFAEFDRASRRLTSPPPNPDVDERAPGGSAADNAFWDWDDFIDRLLDPYPGPLL
jgi:hypothetical protein